VAVCPPWAELLARAFPDVADLQRVLYDHAKLPVAAWPVAHQERAARDGRVDEHGDVHLVESPDHLLVMVCGGLGSLHALALHSFGPSRAVTREVA
jgi:hypothetical protein